MKRPVKFLIVKSLTVAVVAGGAAYSHMQRQRQLAFEDTVRSTMRSEASAICVLQNTGELTGKNGNRVTLPAIPNEPRDIVMHAAEENGGYFTLTAYASDDPSRPLGIETGFAPNILNTKSTP